MLAQLICKDRNQKEMNELYQVIAALCERENIQVEDRGEQVEILVAPQGKIIVTEEDKTMILTANTRHAGPGFHAFVIDFFDSIQQELPGEYEVIDDLEYVNDGDFHRLQHVYEHELDYVKNMILTDPSFRDRNYLYDETFYLPMNKEDRVLTSTGDMDKNEFIKTEVRDLMDHFYVWNDWDKDARYYRNAAMTLLAKEGRGVYSAMNDETEKVANEILDYLDIAHEMDKDMPLPVQAYAQLAEVLGRENKLKDAISMEEEASQYRTKEVYHLFEDARVVAPGAAERSYDPVTSSVNLMAPYKESGEWSWLIQASKSSEIMTDYTQLMEETPIEREGKTIWLEDFEEDGVYVVEGVILQDEKYLYIHAVAAEEKYIPYLRQCILQSGFFSQSF